MYSVVEGESPDATVVTVAKPSVERSTSIPPSEESSLFDHVTSTLSGAVADAETFVAAGTIVSASISVEGSESPAELVAPTR